MELNEDTLRALAYGPLNIYELKKPKSVHFPFDKKFDNEYWYEKYDFHYPNEDTTEIKILQKKKISMVEGESYDGDLGYYLLEIKGEKYIFCDGYSSWGDSNPTLEKAVKKEAYISGDVYFVE